MRLVRIFAGAWEGSLKRERPTNGLLTFPGRNRNGGFSNAGSRNWAENSLSMPVPQCHSRLRKISAKVNLLSILILVARLSGEDSQEAVLTEILKPLRRTAM